MRIAAFAVLFCCQISLAAEAPVSFRGDIAPILLGRCQGCHGPDKIKGGYRLDNFEKLMQPGEGGLAPIIAGHTEKSELYRLITTTDEADRMPKKGEPLNALQIQTVKRWIEAGATFDGPSLQTSLAVLAADKKEPAAPLVYPQPIPVTALAFTPDGTILAAGGYHEVTFWDPTSGKLVGRIPKMAERVYAIDFSPDGQRLAVADGEPGTFGSVKLCDLSSRTCAKTLDRIGDVMLAVKFSPDGSQLAAGGADNIIRIDDAATGNRLRSIEQHADWVMALAWSPDGTKLASASRDKSARVFSTRNGEMLTAFLGHEQPVDSVAWSADGTRVLSAGHDQHVWEWNVVDAKVMGRIDGLGADPVEVVVAGSTAFVCTAGGAMKAYTVDKRKGIRNYSTSTDWLYSIAVDAKHHRLAAGGYSGNITVWDSETGAMLNRWIAAPGLGPH